ncbi:MAG: hypothetical protein M3Y82_14730 [Verrucomicrobiota bacterium]|nr:hypothetical protein [Verrucomicrobiota bacterium]
MSFLENTAEVFSTGAVFSKLIEPNLIQPTFVTHLPKGLVPLAKLFFPTIRAVASTA